MVGVRHLFAMTFLVASLFALKDFGVVGNLYDISEPNLMAEIKKAAKEINKTALTQDVKKSFNENFKSHTGLVACEKNSSRTFRPIYVLKEDIVLPDGSTLYKKGYSFNPLSKLNFAEKIVFFDGKDQGQSTLAANIGGILLLTRGDVRDFEKKYKKRADPSIDKYIESFNVKCVPSIIEQSGELLLIREISAREVGK